jgi:hypothetical protein
MAGEPNASHLCEAMQAAAVKHEMLQRSVQQRNQQLVQQAWQVRGWGLLCTTTISVQGLGCLERGNAGSCCEAGNAAEGCAAAQPTTAAAGMAGEGLGFWFRAYGVKVDLIPSTLAAQLTTAAAGMAGEPHASHVCEAMQAAAVKQEMLQRAAQQRNRQLLQWAWQVRGWVLRCSVRGLGCLE